MTFTDKLRAAKVAAEKATPGPWLKGGWTGQCFMNHLHGRDVCSYEYKLNTTSSEVSIEPNITLIGYNDHGPVLSDKNATHIAAMNPSFTLELIERYEALEGKLEKAREALTFYADEKNWCEQEGIGTSLCDTIDFDDIEEIIIADSKNFDIGGKRARAALKELGQ